MFTTTLEVNISFLAQTYSKGFINLWSINNALRMLQTSQPLLLGLGCMYQVSQAQNVINAQVTHLKLDQWKAMLFSWSVSWVIGTKSFLYFLILPRGSKFLQFNLFLVIQQICVFGSRTCIPFLGRDFFSGLLQTALAMQKQTQHPKENFLWMKKFPLFCYWSEVTHLTKTIWSRAWKIT